MKKTFFWNTLGSSINAFTSLIYLIVVSRINGETVAGAFSIAFSSACLLYYISIYYGRTYHATESDKKISDKDFIVSRYISIILMFIVSFIFILIYKFTLEKSIYLLLLCFIKALESLSDLYHGILQKNDKLDRVGISLTIRGLLNIILFIIFDYIFKNIYISLLSLILIDTLILILYDIKYSKKYIKDTKYHKESIIKLFRNGFYTFAFTFISTYLISIPKYTINSLLTDEIQTIFSIIIMPSTIALLLNQFVLQPFIMSLKDAYDKKNIDLFRSILKKIIIFISLMYILILLVATYLEEPVLSLIYGIDLSSYRYDMLLILVGSYFYSIVNILSNMLIIFRYNKVQFVIYILVFIITNILSSYFIKMYGLNGGCYTYTLSMFILYIIYVITYFISLKKIKWIKKDGSK